jgi:hypothetical protein
MATIPLNYFRRVTTLVTTTPTVVYTAPDKRAGIILSGLATNLTGSTQTITVGISGSDGLYHDILHGFPVPSNDALNVAVGKLVLGTADQLVTYSTENSALNFTLSVLEAVNTP